jgi:adenine phosphoribosyltransferase
MNNISLYEVTIMNLKENLREIKDWPKKGVLFKDISPLLLNPSCFQFIIQEFKAHYGKMDFNKILAIDARGFLFASTLAYLLEKPLILARKKGKLPPPTISESYSLEYGESTLEVSSLAISEGDRIILIDDLIATGGSSKASAALIKKSKAELVGAGFVMDIRTSIGSEFKLECPIFSLLKF